MSSSVLESTYTAATDTALQDRSFRGEAYTLEAAAAPDAAMSYRESAEKMSSEVKRITLTTLPSHADGEGRRENKGSKSGAYFSLNKEKGCCER